MRILVVHFQLSSLALWVKAMTSETAAEFPLIFLSDACETALA